MIHLLNDLLWGKLLIFVLVALGLLLTLASRFVQFRYFCRMFYIFKQGLHHEKGKISSFQALALSVGGRVGAGNIAGVAVAITLGGPGAVFWMWVVGLIGMATSLFECTLAQVFKRAEPDGTFRGGPAYYIEHGLGKCWKWLGGGFSLLILLSFGSSFNALQSFTIASAFSESFSVSSHFSGAFLAFLTGLVIFGGIKRLSQVTEFVVPFMAAAYLLCTLYVMAINFTELPQVIGNIVSSAFGLNQALGGGAGAAILFGVKRGLFSNEAGLGSAPNVAAIAYVKHPVDQGIIQALSVFIDTLVLCSCTATIILLSDNYLPGMEAGGITLTQQALVEHLGAWGGKFISVALFFFGFTSIMYNYYLGENALNYFSEENKRLFFIYRCVTLILIIWGAQQNLSTIFIYADFSMGLLALVNLLALLLLYKVVLRVIRDYDDQLINNKEPVFDSTKYPNLDIDNRAWVER